MLHIGLLSLLVAPLCPAILAEDQIPLSPSSVNNIPSLGFGTWNLKINPTNTSAAVTAALLAGYRHLDCAAIYGNEKEVGKGIEDGLQEVVLKREDIWVTSKLWNDQYAPKLPHWLRQGLDNGGSVIIPTMWRLPWTRH